MAAPPPPARPNRRCDASSRANAGPNRRPAAARARSGGCGGAGLLPTPTARVHRGPVTPRAGPRRRPSGRAALGALAEGGRGGPRSRYLLRGRVLGVVEIPHLRRRLRRQLLHQERLEAATRAPSPRQGDAREGRGGEEAAGPTAAAAAAGAARVACSLVPSLPPAPARRSLPHTLTRGATRTPPAPPLLRPGPLKGHARAARPPPVGAPAAAGRPQAGAGRRARSCPRLPGTISAGPRAAKAPRPLPRAHRGGGG